MSKKRLGFTVIEVVIFLAISGMILLGVFIGTSNSMNQQRFDDATQSFTEFLRTAYSSVIDVQGKAIGESGGRSDQAIYGQLITFGEEYLPFPDDSGQYNRKNDQNLIFSYSIVGDVDPHPSVYKDCNSGNVKDEVLKDLCLRGATAIIRNDDGIYVTASNPSSYALKWGSALRYTANMSESSTDEPFRGMLLIVRSPSSGTVYTYVLTSFNHGGEIVPGDTPLRSPSFYLRRLSQDVSTSYTLDMYFSDGLTSSATNFRRRDIDFCLDFPGDNLTGLGRRNIRILKDTRNAAGVELVPLDDPEANKCNPKR